MISRMAVRTPGVGFLLPDRSAEFHLSHGIHVNFAHDMQVPSGNRSQGVDRDLGLK